MNYLPRTGGQTREYLFYTTFISVDIAHYDIFPAKDGKGCIIFFQTTMYTGSDWTRTLSTGTDVHKKGVIRSAG